MHLRKTHLFAGLILALATAGAAFVVADHLVSTGAQEPGGQSTALPGTMSLDMPNAIACSQDGPKRCTVLTGGLFSIAVRLEALPLDPATQSEAGYVGLQTQLAYDGLRYKLDPIVRNEISWPDSALPVRAPFAPTGTEGLIAHGSVSSLTPPLIPSTHTGTVVDMAMTCAQTPGTFEVGLLVYEPTQRPLGSGFRLLDASGKLGAVVPAHGIGQRDLDLDRDPGTPAETVDVAATLFVECIEPTVTPTHTPGGPTPTDTPTPVPTRTRTPTATPTPVGVRGDTNCDGAVSSVDAALLLQLDAGLTGTLPCIQNGDVNDDGRRNSLDAALVLQRVAGLITTL